MKSIVDIALEKHSERAKNTEVMQSTGIQTQTDMGDDAELAKIVEALRVNIKIIGCGGGGCNTIDRIFHAGVVGARLLAINTDAPHLMHIHSPRKMLIGKRTTKGLGAGALPEVGEEAAKENEDELKQFVDGSNIVFVTAGMGGGTGTGSAQYVARLAKEKGALVLSVVTLPFKGEGLMRMDNALKGVEKLRRYSDTTIVINNDKLLELVPKLPLEAAFKIADEILMNTLKGITEIITKPGLVNIDYNDLQTVMKNGGVAMIGFGESDEDRGDRVDNAINQAIGSPLLGEVDVSQAQGALVRIVGGSDMTITEAQRAVQLVGERISPQARIIWGCTVDPSYNKSVNVLLVLTGVKSKQFIGSQGHPVLLDRAPIKKSGFDSVC
ncbi:MAG: cell division protein FtsZ [Thermoplasmata archaeon]|nr:cell division protein FtsZ [Thermoplasmata archaeon]